jgi:hypothetical protein
MPSMGEKIERLAALIERVMAPRQLTRGIQEGPSTACLITSSVFIMASVFA